MSSSSLYSSVWPLNLHVVPLHFFCLRQGTKQKQAFTPDVMEAGLMLVLFQMTWLLCPISHSSLKSLVCLVVSLSNSVQRLFDLQYVCWCCLREGDDNGKVSRPNPSSDWGSHDNQAVTLQLLVRGGLVVLWSCRVAANGTADKRFSWTLAISGSSNQTMIYMTDKRWQKEGLWKACDSKPTP